MELNQLQTIIILVTFFVWSIAGYLMFYSLNLSNTFLFSLKLPITQNNLVDYTFVNKNDPSKFWKVLLNVLIFMAI